MRTASTALVLALVALSAGLSGCIQGAFFPAVVPESTANAAGWRLDTQNSQSGEKGFEPIVKARYQVNDYVNSGNNYGVLFIISVSNVPLLDEQGEIKKQLDTQLANYGITLTEKSRGSGAIGGDKTDFIVYDAQKQVVGATVTGFAIDAPYTCGANQEAVRAFGFAQTKTSGLINTGTDLSVWRALAGAAETGQLGGLVAAVKCSA